MEPINPAQAQRVWQRVKGPEPEFDAFARLLALEAECRQIYLYLQKHTPLRDSRGLSRLREESRQFFHILTGLAQLRDADVTLTAPPSIRGNAEGLLRQSYAARQKIIELLSSLPADCTGCAELLKPMMEEHCLSILELLGSLPRK